jgi:hypothetical protein
MGLGRYAPGIPGCLALVAAFTFGGCGDAPKAPRVNSEAARAALQTALEAWKSGQTPAALKSGSPAITAQDMDWESGQKLLSFQVLSPGQDDDANLRIPVELTLEEQGGKEKRKKVSYVVSTSPAVTVFRELF